MGSARFLPRAVGVALLLLDIAYMYSRFIGSAREGLGYPKQPPMYCAVSSCATGHTVTRFGKRLVLREKSHGAPKE
jgi:hypothetical protein